MATDAGKRLVVKVGTSSLTDAGGKIDEAYIANLARQICGARAAGWQVILVTSGSIASGLEALGIDERPTDLPSLQAAASVGQITLSRAYSEAFEAQGVVVSSVLLTRDDTANRTRYLHARDTLLRLLELGVVPIVNENDTVSAEQIRFGDNDTLSALVACLVKASEVVILSDIDGLYDKNPSTHADAQLLHEVNAITPDIVRMAEGPGTKNASGGMITKIRAARVLLAAGIPLSICHGHAEDILVRYLAGERVGTRFANDKPLHEITPRKLWIALGDSSHGTLMVDAGAKQALERSGRSLLAVGITAVDGGFESGDIVDIVDTGGYLFARGRVSCASDEAKLACGRSQAELKANRLLAGLADKPVVHRDELVIFD